MGFVAFEVKELVDIILKNTDIPEVITKVEANKNEVVVGVKPAAFLSQMHLKFTVKSSENRISILFDPSKSLIVYGFLLGKFKENNIEGLQLFKDRLEIDLQKVLSGNLEGVKINKVCVSENGMIEIDFCCI